MPPFVIMVYFIKIKIAARGLNCIYMNLYMIFTWSLHEYQINKNTCDTFQQQLNKETTEHGIKKNHNICSYIKILTYKNVYNLHIDTIKID